MRIFGRKWNRAAVLLGLALALSGQAAHGQANQAELERERREQERTQRSAESELIKINAELTKIKGAARTNQSRLAAAQLELRKAQEQVRLQQSRVAVTKRDVNRLSGEIDVTADAIRSGQRHLAARAKELMKSSRLANLELLLKSEDAAEMELNERFLTIEAGSDVALIRTTVEAKTELEGKKAEKETVLAELVQRERELAAARNEVNVRKNALQRLQNELARTTAQKEDARTKTLAMLREIKSKLAAIKSKLQSIQGRYAKPTVFHAPADGDIIDIPVSISGVYISQRHGSVVKTMAEGEVVSIQNMHGHGQTIIVGHGGDLTSVYANLSSVAVQVGQKVRRGQELGRSGTSPYGDATYFAVYHADVPQNPRRYLN
ncbi:MAG: peptidoglycan DD-metalloendopeptidase family protein [Candidatus Hydrogenedentota bacterium]